MTVAAELQALQQLTMTQLRARYRALFGEETRTGNRAWLIRRIIWRWQAEQSGGLSAAARQQAQALASLADLRRFAPAAAVPPPPPPLRRRLPPPGTLLVRVYKGIRRTVEVLPAGFLYEGEVYRSLSGVAKAITGSHLNGYQFFGLSRESRS